jgi:hypothetical protein
MAKLRSQLGGVHDSLAQLHAEQAAGRLQAATPELDQVGGLEGCQAFVRGWQKRAKCPCLCALPSPLDPSSLQAVPDCQFCMLSCCLS